MPNLLHQYIVDSSDNYHFLAFKMYLYPRVAERNSVVRYCWPRTIERYWWPRENWAPISNGLIYRSVFFFHFSLVI